MKNTVWKTVVWVVAFIQPCGAQELAFKDVPLGMSLAEFTKKFERSVNGDARKPPHLDFGTVYSVPTKQVLGTINLRDSGTIQATKTYSFENERIGKEQANDTIAGVPAMVTYWFNAASIKEWDALAEPYQESALAIGKSTGLVNFKSWNDWSETQREIASRVLLGLVRAEFGSTRFESVVDALEVKYGKPAKRETETYQNAMGAKQQGDLVSWYFGDDAVIKASQRAGTVNRSTVVIAKASVINRSKGIGKEASKGNAADL